MKAEALRSLPAALWGADAVSRNSRLPPSKRVSGRGGKAGRVGCRPQAAAQNRDALTPAKRTHMMWQKLVPERNVNELSSKTL